ncbi:MAG: hypothetical protein CRN43_17640 [Candidatus Nephrothrix sp. EaCA]|nr:MAG: hypothetical protein CRN43_17640 [Candidatus Nephrothrix sp. EaCA]
MEVKGKVVQLLPLVTGQGKNGTWKKQEFILETQAQFPKKVCVSLWGDKAELYQLEIGSVVTASIEVESREYNSRWYTDVRAWKIAKDDETPPPPAPQDYPPVEEDKATDDLPF